MIIGFVYFWYIDIYVVCFIIIIMLLLVDG